MGNKKRIFFGACVTILLILNMLWICIIAAHFIERDDIVFFSVLFTLISNSFAISVCSQYISQNKKK